LAVALVAVGVNDSRAAVVPFDVSPDISVVPAGAIAGGTLIGSPFTYYNIQFAVDGGATDVNIRTARTIDAGGPGVVQVVSDGYNGSSLITKGANSYINTPFAAGDVIGDGVDEALRGADNFNVINDGGFQLFAEGTNYLGLKLASGNFGYVEVDYDSATSTYTFLGGAYESGGGSITAGGVPEPATLGMALLSLGAVAALKRRT
jgi:hypothetical protein